MVDEQDTMVNLPLLAGLTYREWHAFVEGVYVGTRWGSRQHEYGTEDHYWRTGYLLGTGLRYSCLALVYYYVIRDES